jgi:hypothetical protein
MTIGYKVGHSRPFFELLDGDVYFWVEPDEAIYMEAVDRRSRDPKAQPKLLPLAATLWCR